MVKKKTTQPTRFVSTTDYFGISAGNHVNIIETVQGSGQVPTIHKCLVSRYKEEGHWDQTNPKKPEYIVTKEGGDAIHYLYDFEVKEYDVKKIIEDGIMFLAGTNSVSAGRALTDILIHIDGGEMPEKLTDWRLCPSSFIQELFKVVGDQGLTVDDALDIADGKLTKKAMRRFVEVYYRVNFQHIAQGVKHWDTLKTVVGATQSEVKG